MDRIDSDHWLHWLIRITKPEELIDTQLWWLSRSNKLKSDVEEIIQRGAYVRIEHPDDEDVDWDIPRCMWGYVEEVPVAIYQEGELRIEQEKAIKDDEGTLWVAGVNDIARLALDIEPGST